jgi:cytochrome d ubiquinol oxidase subunit I
MIEKAAWDTVPNVPLMFWSFRFMAGTGFLFIALFGAAFVLTSVGRTAPKWLLRTAVVLIPLPWIAAESGWVLAEIGRQPWAIDGVLPTALGASSLTRPELWATIIGFTLIYGALAVVEMGLMVKAIGKGPYPSDLTPKPPSAPVYAFPIATPAE